MKNLVAIGSMIFFLVTGLFISELISSRSAENQSLNNQSDDQQTIEDKKVESQKATNQPVENKTDQNQTVGGFSFNCDNTPNKPCQKLVAKHQGKEIEIEPSGVVWSKIDSKAIIVNDNYNDLVTKNAGHYSIVSFSLKDNSSTIPVTPLLTPKQGVDYPLYDLEGVTLLGDTIYAIGSLALHGKNPERDRWERHQFVKMSLIDSKGELKVKNISHVNEGWKDFRNWLISKSGYSWTGEQTRGKAEGNGINVEALTRNTSGNLVLGFRGPLLQNESVLALELSLPSSKEMTLVQKSVLPQVKSDKILQDAPKGLRGMAENPEKPGEYYILVGPKGYEKELIVLARWNSKTGELSKVSPLPPGIVGEGVVPIGKNKLLIVDDLNQAILIATEN